MAKIFAVLPNPNNFDTGDGLNTGGFRFNNPAGSSNNQYTGKVDHNLWDGHRVFFRYSWFRTYSIDSLNSADATFPGFPQGAQGGVRWGFSAGSDWTLTPTTVNELRVGHQSANVDFLRPGRLTGNTIISNLFTDPYNSAFAQGRNSPVDEVTDNLTKLSGKHTFKFGGTWRRTKQWGYNDAGIYPNVTTGTTLGNAVPANIGPTVASGTINSANRQVFESLYNDVLGRMNQVTQTFYSDLATFQAPGTPRVRTFLFNEQGYFFQDDWKIRRNLTINLGLRWEYSSVPSEADGQQGVIDRAGLINSVSQISNFAVAKSGDWYKNDFNNFAPRIGFAWDVRGDGRTAIRGAFGMFYDRIIGATTSSVDGATPGFSQSVPVYPNQAAGSDVRAADGIPKPAQPGAPVLVLPNSRANTISVFDPNLRTGYVNQFNLSVQRELARNTILEVSYVGSRGVKLFMNVNPDQQRVFGEFLTSFKELQAFQTNPAAPISAGNTLVRIFGTPTAAISNLGAANFTQGLVGTAATNLDRTYYTRYAAAGVSDFYLRNFPQYIELRQGTNAGRSYYNSAQFSIRRNMSSLQVYANYTFSKSMDNGSAEGNGYTAPIDSFNLALNRGRSDWDRPHTFNASVTYVVPFGKGKRFGGDMPDWLSSAIGGWELGGLSIWQSGSVYTVSSARSTIHGATNSWANFSGSSRNFGEVTRKGDGVYWMTADQIAAFSFPAAGEFGTSGRNSFRGPRYFNIDLSLVKKFRLTENHAVTFRAEGYNVLNNPNFANPSVSLTAPASFGKISSMTGGPRIYQLALRYDF
jgi:hypothetical protein